ncbi:MAG: hypothetical protein M3Q50_12210 [Chloroflexota bacterium]|nr:hypothetical protein [Chloroflexia bacterium]MDQ3227382.1 hypothetical protein [Chloroflexota bacterium]
MVYLPTQREERDEADSAATVWAFLLVLFCFKLATVGLIFWHMRTFESGIVLGSTLWYWFPPLLLLGAGPVVFYYRLRKVRARRDALQRSEWMVGDGQDVDSTAVRRR